MSNTDDALQETISAIVAEAMKETFNGDGAQFKINVDDIIKQLSNRSTDLALRHYLSWPTRLMDLIRERSKRAARDTYDFIDENMSHALYEMDQFKVIEAKKNEIMELNGYILDLGVYKGGSTRALAKTFPTHTIHGFDSFEGLPEDWDQVGKGTFGEIKGLLPDMPSNVKLYKGWFDDTLPVWTKENTEPYISLLRVDCDIYSSTKTIFKNCTPYLSSGSWIVFDELIGYYGWKHHEYKAFMEFIEETGFEYEYVSYGLTYTLLKLL